VVELLDAARRASARVVNMLMTATYWEIGRRIVQCEQAGERRAAYGMELLTRLSADLTKRFGREYSVDNLERARKFYLTFAAARKSATSLWISAPAGLTPISATSLRKSSGDEVIEWMRVIAEKFPLPWSHYTRLLRLRSAHAVEFYHAEAMRGGWTVKQLERQMNSQFYERTALSRNKAGMLVKGQRRLPEDKLSADEEIRNPFLLEFLGLKDEYSENDLEEALISTWKNSCWSWAMISRSLDGSGGCGLATNGFAWTCCSFIAACAVWSSLTSKSGRWFTATSGR
jgi:predicted nuclease of restriction endonuclease-like (RecB) superfamily